MDKFDRNMQLILLEEAVSVYPRQTDQDQFLNKGIFHAPEKAIANIYYLYEHGLITISHPVPAELHHILCSIKATKDGIDFMLQDGGLNAILNITTIKFHDDAVSVIAEFVNKNVSNPADKQRFLHQLHGLPYETTKHIALELVSKGLAQMPNAVQWLQTLLHHS